MMRFMLHENMQESIPLQKEIEYLDNYINLQKLRIQNLPIHRSYIVGLKHIDKIEKHQLWVNGTALSIGSVYIKAVSEYLDKA